MNITQASALRANHSTTESLIHKLDKLNINGKQNFNDRTTIWTLNDLSTITINWETVVIGGRPSDAAATLYADADAAFASDYDTHSIRIDKKGLSILTEELSSTDKQL